MKNRTVWLVSLVGLLLMAAVVSYGLLLNSDNAVSRLNAAASAAVAVGGFLAFVVLVFYTAETYRLRIAAEKQLDSQHRVQEDQVKLSLFDKRFFVYVSLRQFLNRLSELGTTLDAAQLLQDTNQAEFLFKPEIEEFLKQVYRRAHKLQSLKQQEAHAKQQLQGLVPVDLSNQLDAESGWLISEAPKLARQKFEPYLILYMTAE